MIMAGGAGTRLWPMSRPGRPKQLLPLAHGASLLDVASRRLDGLVPQERQWLCTSESLRAPIRRDLDVFTDDRILGEPEGRDTVNAVGLTAAVLVKNDPDAIFAVLTSDHLISPEAEFRSRMDVGFSLVEQDPSRFVTFSIHATWPAECYGYVKRGDAINGFDGAFLATEFHEKPDEPTAKRFLADEKFGWNSGMFVFQAAAVLGALKRFMPKNHATLMTIADAWGTPDQERVLNDLYPTLEKNSVDYGIMEPASKDDQISLCVVPMKVDWRDLGSWPSVAETLKPDADGNRAIGEALHEASSNVLTVCDEPGETISTIGVSDLIVIRSGKHTLVCHAKQAEEVKAMAQRAAEKH